MTSNSKDSLPPGHLLSERYRLEEELGAGGMALVYRAEDLLLERTVAIKLLREDFSRDPAFRERFRQEAKAAANLSHPNIVTVYDFGLGSEHLFIVMEHVPGENLKDILKRRGRIEVEKALPIIIQACAGIGYAHRAGLVHCDVKPHNILVSPDQRVKVTDFGIARALASIRPDEKSEYVWGSPQYFSPEQASGSAPAPASDVYSLGVVLYEMLTGRLPFTDDDQDVLARRHREDLPPAPRSLNPDLSPALEKIIFKVLSKEPAARYRTADQLGRVLITFSKPRSRSPEDLEPTSPQPPPDAPVPLSPVQAPPEPVEIPPSMAAPFAAERESFLDLDWVAVVLGLLALIAVGGLIPFWLWVYFVYNPPTP